ncbi:MAG: DNA-directed RNA polymerase subunit omega [Victivallales bacterium]|nr:DNA-directed RNA polymerase subunit omega [Victivallales bacterium]
MNEEYLARAREKVSDVRLFINGVSKRASQLAKGDRRLVPTLPNDERSHLDIALLEVAEGKIVIDYRDDVAAEEKHG